MDPGTGRRVLERALLPPRSIVKGSASKNPGERSGVPGCAPTRAIERVRQGRSVIMSTASSAIRRYVVSLPPVTVIDPVLDRDTRCLRETSDVVPSLRSSGSSIETSGPEPANVPSTSAAR